MVRRRNAQSVSAIRSWVPGTRRLPSQGQRRKEAATIGTHGVGHDDRRIAGLVGVSDIDQRPMIDVDGDLDVLTSPQLHDAITDVLGRHPPALCVQLANVGSWILAAWPSWPAGTSEPGPRVAHSSSAAPAGRCVRRCL
jgi:hypothetical protein